MEGEGVKDYLRDIGRDVASSLGEELKGVAKEKATSFVKEQFGLGFQDELKAAGRDILSSVGDELKGAARDKATSMIKEQFGLGVVDNLKSAGRRLRGKPTDAEMRERLEGIAGTVGQPLAKTDPLKGVRSAGTKMLLKQLGMDGGAIARPCSVKLSDLRKAITAARRGNHIVGKATREQLIDIGEAHADMGGKHARAIGRYLKGNMTVPRLREMRGLIKGAYHRPVSELSMSEAIDYVYWTAKDLGWSWSQLDGIAPKRRQPRGCRVSKHPGRSRDAPARTKRAPSAYNLFVQQHMQDPANKVDEEGDPLSNKERFSNAVAAWRAGGTRRAAGTKAAATRRSKKDEAARRAAVKRDVMEERKAAKAAREKAGRERMVREYGPSVRKKIPRKAKSTAPKQYGKGAAYDSGSESD
jgi:hypothetical protein